MTGLWQVSGKNNTTFEEMMQLDIRYVRTHTPMMDLWIITRTIPALVTQVIETRARRAVEQRSGALSSGEKNLQPLKQAPLAGSFSGATHPKTSID